MDSWDPKKEDFESDFNTYDRGPGKNLNKNNKQEGVKLYVTGIPNEVSEEGLYNLFSKCGNCLHVKKCISRQKDSGETFGFITMESEKEAIEALKEYNAFLIGTSRISVRIALDEEALKKRLQQKQEEEEFINTLPSTKYEQQKKLKKQIKKQKKKLTAITRTIENKASDVESGIEGKYPKKKTSHTTLNGQADSLPGLQKISSLNTGQLSNNYKFGFCDNSQQGILGPAPLIYGTGNPGVGGQSLLGSQYGHAMPALRHVDHKIDDVYNDPSLIHVERSPKREDFVPEIFHSHGRGQGILGYGPKDQTWQQRSGFRQRRGKENYYGRGGPFNYNNNYSGGYGRGGPQNYHNYHDDWNHGYRRGGLMGYPRGGYRGKYQQYMPYSDYDYDEPDYRDNSYRGRYHHHSGGGYRPSYHSSTESISSTYEHPQRKVKSAPKIETRPCLNCENSGKYQCCRCKSPYCSEACQTSHWPRHKKDCAKIKEDSDQLELLENQFEITVGNDMVQKTKTLVENHTGDKVVIKPKDATLTEKKQDVKKQKNQSQYIETNNNIEQTSPPRSGGIQTQKSSLSGDRVQTSRQPAKQETEHLPKQNDSNSLMSETKGKILKPSALPMKISTQVIISEVASPGEIWLQLCTEEVQALIALGETMKTAFQNNTDIISNPRVGDIFGCIFSCDNEWYRARVDAISGDQISVTYIDYGNKEIVTVDKLRKLEDSMTELPIQAIECYLTNVKPLSGDEWGSSAIEMMKTLAPLTIVSPKLFTVSAVSKSDGKFAVTLQNDQGEDIGLQLIVHGVVSARKEDASSGSREVDNKTVHKAEPTLPNIVYSTLPQDKNTTVILSEVVSPGEIWLQLFTDQFQALVALGETMKSAFQNNTDIISNPRVGDIFGCIFSCDSEWYRARVDAISGDQISVTYIDYGNKEIVTVDKLRKLEDSMTELPIQAIECYLTNVKPLSGDEWGSSAIEMMKTLAPLTIVSQKLFTVCTVSKSDGKFAVTLQNDQGEDIGLQLIVHGVVSARKEDASSGSREVDNKTVHKAEPTLPNIVYSTLPQDKNTTVMVMEVESPDEIWVQEADATIVEKGMKATEELNLLAEEDKLKLANDLCMGDLCASQFEGSWYRARIDAFKSNNTVLVTYVDFGNKDVVQVSSLRELDSKLKSVPLNVVHCCLGGIVPVGQTTEWNEAVINELKRLVPRTQESSNFYTVTAQKSADHVTVIKLKNDADEDVAMKLIDTGRVKAGEREPPVFPPVAVSEAAEFQPIRKNEETESIPAVYKAEPTLPSIVYLTLSQDKDTMVMVLEIESPDEIWVQEADQSIFDIGLNVAEELRQQAEEDKLKSATDLSVGDLCASNFMGCWYRAHIDALKSNNTVLVTYIDYGNKDVVEVSSLRELDSKLKSLPATVIHCSLGDIVPVGQTTKWDTNAITKLKELVPKTSESTKFYYAKVLKMVDGVTVIRLRNAEGEDIASKMINAGVGKAGKREPLVDQPVAEAAPKIQPLKRQVFQASSLRTMIDEYEIEQKFDILIIASTSPTDFTIQICSNKQIRNFHDFQQQLNNACSLSESPYRPEQIGQLVVGKFDGMWYRAEVLSISDKTAKVRYIDFGNEEENDFTTIQSATEECTRLPAQACECSLVGIGNPLNGVWPSDVMQKFKEMTSEMDPKPLEAVYKGKVNERAMIDIIDYDCNQSVASVISQMMSGVRPKSPAAVAHKQNKLVAGIVNESAVMKASDIPMEVLSDGKRIAAGVIEIERFDSFYIQLVDQQNTLMQLQEQLANYCSDGDTQYTPVIGEIVCAKFSADNNWYRAEVLDKEELYTVLFVDFGNKEGVSSQNIRQIQSSLLSVPKQAIHCQLAGVVHENQIEESFQNFEFCMKQALVHVVASELKNGKYSVTMFGADDLNINEQFGTKGKKPSTDLHPAEGVVTVTQKQERVLSPYPAPPLPQTIDNIEQVSPPETGEFNVVITSIENPEEFYCQIADQTAVEKLTLMMQNMMLTCETNAANPDFCPQVGDLCSAQYSGDKRWYRSVVQKLFSDKTYQVKYLDFGNKEVIGGSDMRESSSDFMDLPVLAFECSLPDIMPVSGQSWSTDAGVKLGSFYNVPLIAKLVGKTSSGAFILDLTHFSEEGSVNIAQSLISTGVAKTRTVQTGVSQPNDAAVDKETLILEQIAALQAQLQAMKSNKQ